jgi:hypothetical protein
MRRWNASCLHVTHEEPHLHPHDRRACDRRRVRRLDSDQPTVTAGTLPGVSASGQLCVFRGADGLLTVAVLSQSMTKADFTAMARKLPGVQEVSGIGDSAFAVKGTAAAGGASLLVLKGSTYLSLSATSTSKDGDALLTALEDLAKKVVDKV